MIDTHAHLDFEQFDADRQAVIENFLNGSGKYIVNIGVDRQRNKLSAELAEKFEKVYFSVGFHPEEAGKISAEETTKELESYVENKKLVAIGEIGLEYFYLENEILKDEQKKLFVAQLDFAREHKLPVVIHCRDAYEDLAEIISREEYEAISKVIHCYGGNAEDTEIFLKIKNLFFSFTGNITFKNVSEGVLDSIRMIPLERLMVETDCPFLAPQIYRGKRNEPIFVKEVIKKVADIKGIDETSCEAITDETAIGFFGL